jgi:hypothetical protein
MRISIKYSIYKGDCYCSLMAKTQTSAHKAITTKVVGGIGNQLFCYFAGYYLANKLGYRLKVDVSDIRKKRSVHDVSIEVLDLPGAFFETTSTSAQLFLNRIRNKTNRIIPKLRISRNSFVSKEIGFDPLLDKITSPSTIQGYFQSYLYFSSYPRNGQGVKLKNPSSWYIQMEKNVANQEFTSLHVRRGDYRNHSETFGLLSVNYYEQAIRLLSQRGELHTLLIFSDDIQAAREMLKFVAPADSVWINPPKESNPVESLLLMSKAKSSIIANSTYSWWGAALNFEKGIVIAPKKWFRSMPDPQDLYPPEWHTIESYWEF